MAGVRSARKRKGVRVNSENKAQRPVAAVTITTTSTTTGTTRAAKKEAPETKTVKKLSQGRTSGLLKKKRSSEANQQKRA